MADVKAGQEDAQQDDGLDDGEQQQGGAEGEGGEEKQQRQAERTYTQAELDRILGKVRKNARYLGRKEAEAELRAQGATAAQARETVDRQQEQQLKPPKREDFENYEDYLDAKTDYRTRLVSKEEREKAEGEARAQRVADERKSSEREFRKHAEAVMKEIPDFAETIESAENVMITEAMGEAITEAGKLGPRILYFLVQNPEEAERISGIKSKAAQAREIGKLEARIEAELAAAAKKGKGKDKDEQEEAGEEDAGDDDKGGDDLDESEADGKGKDAERRADGTFKPVKKRAAPEPIEPGTARGATGSRLPSDKDDINTWMRKEEERERREGRR